MLAGLRESREKPENFENFKKRLHVYVVLAVEDGRAMKSRWGSCFLGDRLELTAMKRKTA